MSNVYHIFATYGMESHEEQLTDVSSDPTYIRVATNNQRLASVIDKGVTQSRQDDAITETITGTVSVMEEVSETTQEIVQEQGSLSNEGFAMLQVTIKSLGSLVGVSSSNSLSLESFRANDRNVSSVIALEGIKETLVKVWKKIKAWLKMAWDNVKKFVKLIFSSKARMKRNLKLARDLINKDNKKKLTPSDVSGIAKFIGNEGKQRIGHDISKLNDELITQLKNTMRYSELGTLFLTKINHYAEGQSFSSNLLIKEIVEPAVQCSPIITGRVIKRDEKNKDFKELTSIFSHLTPTVPDTKEGELKGELELTKLMGLVDFLDTYYTDYIEYNKNFEHGMKVFNEFLEFSISKMDNKQALLTKNMVMASLKFSNGTNPSKFASTIMGVINAVCKTIIKHADKKVLEENEKEVKETEAELEKTEKQIVEINAAPTSKKSSKDDDIEDAEWSEVNDDVAAKASKDDVIYL